ncbi:MAG TPA: hypothetical protein DD656_01590 [Alphaproteobacteria bacterium]|nr:hypothetical protein [Paracoccaceae bacterium]HBQ22406.1 hypothetical protein [Alphaproteobacteria bacterium]HCJ62059.1 hypothetical protein [Alphaproteobacteria bacterium]
MSFMRRFPLHALAHGRAGDKGDVSNVSIIAYKSSAWELLKEKVTPELVHETTSHLGVTNIRRYLLPNLCAMNFVLENALDGGVNASRSLDRHGKTLSFLLLSRIYLETPEEFLQDNSPYLDPQFCWEKDSNS